MIEGINIGKHTIGPGYPCFIIAEAGVNHNGEVELAKRMVDAAAEAGADAVKFQTFQAEKLVSPGTPKADYQIRNADSAESHFEMIKRLELGKDAHRQLVAHCGEQDILFLSSPFDEESADFLDELDVAAFKIPSGEITNLPYLTHIARKGKPMIVSTGMATLDEVEEAIRVIREADDPGLILLQCVSNYPALPADVNLRAMETMSRAFGVPVGYSDHTFGNEVAFAAVALGACVVEKHFTLDRNLPGPDHRASVEPADLAALVQGIRAVELALGDGCKRPAPSEVNTAGIVRKSLVVAQDVAAGTVLSEDLIAIKRPGTGLPASMLPFVIGRRTRRDMKKNTLLRLEDLV